MRRCAPLMNCLESGLLLGAEDGHDVVPPRLAFRSGVPKAQSAGKSGLPRGWRASSERAGVVMRVIAGEGAQRTLARARGIEIPLLGNPREGQLGQGRVRTTRWRAHRCARSSSPAWWSSIRASGGLGPRPSLTSSAHDPQHAAKFLGARRRRRIRTAPPNLLPQRSCPPIGAQKRGAQPMPRPSFCLSATASPWVSDG